MKPKLILALATTLTLIATSAAAEQIGVLKRAQGHVALERAGVTAQVPPGTALQRGDRLITGDDGYASVTMRRSAPLTVGPGTDLALDHYAADALPVVKRPAPAILQGLASFLAVNRQR